MLCVCGCAWDKLGGRRDLRLALILAWIVCMGLFRDDRCRNEITDGALTFRQF